MSREKEGLPVHWLALIAGNQKQLAVEVQGAFMQGFLRSIVGREVSEEESVTHWRGILARQSQLVEKLGRSVTVITAAVDYFEDLGLLQNLVLLDHEELSKLRYDASTDPLTGLYNRRMFDEYLDQEIDRATRYGLPFALLCLDLHDFKSVNDTYGHAMGDRVLRHLARACVETLRGSDIPCRIGGDEFAILIPQTERPGAEILLRRIVRTFEGYARPLAPKAKIGIDGGIAIFPEDGQDAAGLFTTADRGLYACKETTHGQGAGRMEAAPTRRRRINEFLPTQIEEPDGVDTGAPSPASPAVPAVSGEKKGFPQQLPELRKFERILPHGISALGIVRVKGQSRTVRVLDACPEGVGLLLDQTDLPDTFHALLQVPVLPGGEVTLNRVYSLPLPEGRQRVGCALTYKSAPLGV